MNDAGAEAAKALGWIGKRVEVRRIRQRRADKIAAALTANDAPAAAWFRRHEPGRILVMAHSGGNLLVNHEAGVGYSIEPGTLDAEMMV